MTSLVNADISENTAIKNDNFLTTVTTAYSKPSSSTASSKKVIKNQIQMIRQSLKKHF